MRSLLLSVVVFLAIVVNIECQVHGKNNQPKPKPILINPWTGREVELENAEKRKQMELGTKSEIYAAELVDDYYADRRQDDIKKPGSEYYTPDGIPIFKSKRKSPYGRR